MINHVTRNEIFKTKKIIYGELAKIQKAFCDEDILLYYQTNNEEEQYLEAFDCLGKDEICYPVFNKIISLVHSDIYTFTGKLTEKLTALFQSIHATDFIIITHLKNDFFTNNNNSYRLLKNAYKKLETVAGNKTYKDAFSIDLDALPLFIEILFWIVRCDPGAPEYYLFDANEQVQINLCKYGNIHLKEFQKELLDADKLKAQGWTLIEGREFDNFTDRGKIKGQRIKA